MGRTPLADHLDEDEADSFLDDVPTVPWIHPLLLAVAANDNAPVLPNPARFERMVREVIRAAHEGSAEDAELTNAVLTASCKIEAWE